MNPAARTVICLVAMTISITACMHSQRREWTAKNLYEAVESAKAEQESFR